MTLTRRQWLAFGGIVLASTGCGRKKGTGYPGYALIAAAGDDALAAIDLTAFQLVKTIPLGAAPAAVMAAREPGFSYALTPATGTVHVINSNLSPIAARKLAGDIQKMQLTADGGHAAAISAGDRVLLIAETDGFKVVRREKLEAEPIALDLAPTGFAAVSTGKGVELFNIADGGRWRVALNGDVGAVRFRSDGKLLLIARPQGRTLTAVKVPELQILADLPLAMEPQNLCFTPDGGQLFVTGEGMDAVAIVFPYQTLEVEQTVLAGRDPGVMACSGVPQAPANFLFVGNASGSDVSILNVDARKVIGVVQVGRKPSFIAITPDDQYALVLNEGSGDVAIIRVSAIRANRFRTGAALFTMLPVGNRPVHCAIVTKPLG